MVFTVKLDVQEEKLGVQKEKSVKRLWLICI